MRDFLVKDAVNFFTLAHFNCPPEFNPADFLLNVIWLDYKPKAAEAGITGYQLLEMVTVSAEVSQAFSSQQCQKMLDPCVVS